MLGDLVFFDAKQCKVCIAVPSREMPVTGPRPDETMGIRQILLLG
jgi:hypothetical protein